MRAYGRRKSLAIAAGLLAAVTACTSDAQTPPTRPAVAASATPSPTPPERAVTRDEAADAFTAFTLTDDLLRVDKNMENRLEWAKDLVTGGQGQLALAAYLSTGYAPPRYRWGAPTLFVPTFRKGEQAPWFSALATRNDRPTLLTFAKSGEDWRLSSAAELLEGQRLPEIKLDAEGYAETVPADDKTVTISPQYMGPVHASVAETGTAGVTAGLIADGPYTTEIAEQIATYRAQAKVDGLSYDSIFSADNYPVYALRTANGGALIQYSLSRNTSTKNMTDESYIIPVPKDASWALTDPTVPRSLKLTEIHQYATTVPPLSAPAPAAVIAHDGALTRAIGD